MTIFPDVHQLLNPYPFFESMRRNHPVAFAEEHNIWAVYRYEDVKNVLSNFETFSSDATKDPRFQKQKDRPMARTLISTDPPIHKKLRDLVSRAFTIRAVTQLEPRIEDIANQMLDQVAERGHMELIQDLAAPLPIIVIAEMMGIPSEDRDLFKRWADQLIDSAGNIFIDDVNPEKNPQQILEEMNDYFQKIIEQRRAEPKEDLISSLIAAEIDGEKLTEEDLLSFCALLLIAGHVTTVNLIGNTILSLLEHPEELARVYADPNLIPSAIEETLRYRAPVQLMSRIAVQDVELGGKTIKSGQRILAWIGSANRDEDKFDHPNQFDISRNPNHHIAFGHGIHFCIGAPLARLEGKVAISILLERFKNLKLRNESPLKPADGFIIHGVQSLPLSFESATRKEKEASNHNI